MAMYRLHFSSIFVSTNKSNVLFVWMPVTKEKTKIKNRTSAQLCLSKIPEHLNMYLQYVQAGLPSLQSSNSNFFLISVSGPVGLKNVYCSILRYNEVRKTGSLNL